MKAKLSITVDKEVVKEIDHLRRIANRSAFANYILKLGLKTYKTEEKIARGTEREYSNPVAPDEANMEA
jgi:metal-responsive CopG/Arc/MetJ family transcriptional regulator